MTKRISAFVILFAAPVLFGACSGPFLGINLQVVGEKTALERQVLGTYEEIGRDLSAYASVRGVNPDGTMRTPPRTTDSQAEVLQAFSNRKYNRDDLDTLLTNGIVGEGMDGMLAAPGAEAATDSSLNPALVSELISEENRDRAVIIERLMKTTPGVTEVDRAEVGWIFATLNQELAPAGARLQTKTGEWKTK